MSLKNLNVDREMIIFAFRYSIGRMTFAPTIVVDNVKNNIDKITKEDMELMVREINEAKQLGMRCDVAVWTSFKEYLEKEIQKR